MQQAGKTRLNLNPHKCLVEILIPEQHKLILGVEYPNLCEYKQFSSINLQYYTRPFLNTYEKNGKLRYLKICTKLVQLLHPEIQIQNLIERDFYKSMPQVIRELTQDTNGYLIFKTQAAKLIGWAKNYTYTEAMEWVNKWNKKEFNARAIARTIIIQNYTLEKIILMLNPYPNNHFFISEPIIEAKWIYLNFQLNAELWQKQEAD